MPTNSPVIANFTMIPLNLAASGSKTTIVNGRTYTCASGAVLNNVPAFDVGQLEANGWVKSVGGGAGTTAQRPVSPQVGTRYYDSTVGAEIIWTGKIWAHFTTGASS